MTTFPRCGREVRVRVGGRWVAGAWGYHAESGAPGVFARIGGDTWWPVGDAATAWRERRGPLAGASDTPAARRPDAPVVAGCAGPYTEAEVIRRVTRAILTLKEMHDPEWRFLAAGGRINWPATVDSAEDKRAQRENQSNLDPRPARFRPQPADLADLDEAVGWFLALGTLDDKARRRMIRAGRLPLGDEQRRLWRHVMGWSYAKIAQKEGVSDETARRRVERAWERLWHIATARWHGRHAARGRAAAEAVAAEPAGAAGGPRAVARA